MVTSGQSFHPAQYTSSLSHRQSPSILARRAALSTDSALAVEIHEDWVEAIRYLNMKVLKEQLKEQRRELVPAA
jgi:hypothetical protein